MGFWSRLFGKKDKNAKAGQEDEYDFSEEEYEKNYELKSKGLEAILGPMYHLVIHAIIPFQVGGAVDLYPFCEGIPGTGFATMELLEPDGAGPQPNRIGTYELVAFTKLSIPPDHDPETMDEKYTNMQSRISNILTGIGHYSYEAVLNPGDTCELPVADDKPNLCLILDEYDPEEKGFYIGGRKHCLLLCMEVHRVEMDYARDCGSGNLLKLLKNAGYYPYSDLDRPAVVPVPVQGPPVIN